MGLLGAGRPNVRALARRGNEDGLIAAAAYRDRFMGYDSPEAGAEVREQAILALGALGPEAGNGTVARGLCDSSDQVRAAAVRVLSAREQVNEVASALAWLPRRGVSRSLAIRAILAQRRPGTARTVAGGLVRAIGDDLVAEEDLALLHTLIHADESADVEGEVVEELLQALADDHELVAERAEVLLTRLAPASTPRVIAELRTGAVPQRAASVLGQIRDASAVDPLLEALRHPRADVRAAAAEALGALRDTAAVEALLGATRDPDFSVRASAGSALDQLGTAAVMVGISALMRPALAPARRSAG